MRNDNDWVLLRLYLLIIHFMKKILFSPPDMSEAEINGVCDALNSGWITTGPRTKEFERKIATYCHTNRAVCLNSATACMESILRVLGVGAGDEVITSAYTYTATASVTCHVGAKVVMVDTAPDSFEMDYDKLAKAITPNTKVVIPVDLGGVMCDYDRIYEAVESKRHLFKSANEIQKAFGRVIVLADSAHAFGAQWHGKMCGEVADFTSFSFHAVKNLTTAEGGALTWRTVLGVDDETLYKQFQLLSLHGQNKDALAKTRLGAWEYDIVAPYYKCNMTDIMAAIGMAQFERYAGMLSRRQEIIRRYYTALGSLLKGNSSEKEAEKIELLMNMAGITIADRKVAVTALERAKESDAPAAALELEDGRIITGKTSNLLGASAALLLNVLKELAGVDHSIRIISPESIEPIQKLKVEYLKSKNPRLHTDEVLIALSGSAATNPLAELALSQLPKLKGCQAHTSVMLSDVDIKTFKKLGVQLTCEAVYEPSRRFKV